MKQSIVPFVLAIIIERDKYLLTKRQEIDKDDPKDFYNKWQLVGGGIDFGETAQEALLREVEEEVGLKVKIVLIVPYILNSVRPNWQGHGFVFLCRPQLVRFNVRLNHESSEYRWFTFQEILKLKTLPGVKEAIKTALKSSNL